MIAKLTSFALLIFIVLVACGAVYVINRFFDWLERNLN